MDAAAADLPVAILPRSARTWPGRYAGWLALGGFALLLLFASLLIRREGVRIGLELDAAAQEGQELRVRQEALRDQLFELSHRLDDSESRRRSFPTAIGGGRDFVPEQARN